MLTFLRFPRSLNILTIVENVLVKERVDDLNPNTNHKTSLPRVSRDNLAPYKSYINITRETHLIPTFIYMYPQQAPTIVEDTSAIAF